MVVDLAGKVTKVVLVVVAAVVGKVVVNRGLVNKDPVGFGLTVLEGSTQHVFGS